MKRFVSIISVLAVLVLPARVLAHVTVKPSEVRSGSFQTFSVSVPNEKDNPTTQIKLEMPDGLSAVIPTLKSGWSITTEKRDDDTIASIVWSGGSIPEGFRDDFTFSAKVPDEATQLTWKAYQNYADGTVVSWSLTADEQPKNPDGSPDFSVSGPFSITNVTTDEAGTDSEAEQSENIVSRQIAIVALVFSFSALVLTARKKNK